MTEIEQLRLAICGGEDAPGYAMSLPLRAILDVARENDRAWTYQRERAEAAERVAGGLYLLLAEMFRTGPVHVAFAGNPIATKDLADRVLAALDAFEDSNVGDRALMAAQAVHAPSDQRQRSAP